MNTPKPPPLPKPPRDSSYDWIVAVVIASIMLIKTIHWVMGHYGIGR